MPSATSRRLSGCDREAAMPATRLAADKAPKRSSAASRSGARSYRSAASFMRPAATSWSTRSSPSPSMSIAEREA